MATGGMFVIVLILQVQHDSTLVTGEKKHHVDDILNASIRAHGYSLHHGFPRRGRTRRKRCKHIAKLNGNPCQSGVPSKCCVWFGKMGRYLVERGYADRYSKAETYKLLKVFEDAGLVHFTSNLKLSENIVLCNCCECCCLYIKKQKRVRDIGLEMTETSIFLARVDTDSCFGCGECVDAANMKRLRCPATPYPLTIPIAWDTASACPNVPPRACPRPHLPETTPIA